ncbi:MAG: response regulator transcription factor [Chloroflexi bacterium]|nr:response regulator transcription factor [Chloroflexota bacterium]
MPMRVLLADDHALFRDGIASLLQAWGYEVVGQASDGLEALQQARKLHPDLILMDVRMPRCTGLESTRLIKAEMPEVKVVIVTVSEDEEDLFEAIKSGAQGYILKNIAGAEFVELINGMARGDAPIQRHLAAKILEEFARHAAKKQDPSASPEEELTDREMEVLRLVARGSTNKDIAQTLFISPDTTKFHLRNIMQKLHLQNRAQVISYALRRGIGLDEPRT